MNRKILILSAALLTILLSCSRLDKIDERLDSLDSRVEFLQNRMTSNIMALSLAVTALENSDYIISAEPVYDNGKAVGYNLVFAKGGKVTIYNGEKGDKGEDGDAGKSGADGVVPVIGVKPDTLGCWYWTLDGEWLKDEQGMKVPAIARDGKDGQDGLIPQLKIEDGWWKISYDGTSWTTLGKASGEDGKDSEPMIASLESTEEAFSIILADGTVIRISTWAAYSRMKERADSLNRSISALRAVVLALEEADYVTNVSRDENGCFIMFKHGGSFYIPDGQDGNKGEQGETGAKGHSPQMSVGRSEDMKWYWKIDGEWLLSSAGQKIPVAGDPGENGKDGITPLFDLRDGKWYVSCDNGENWEYAGESDGSDCDEPVLSVDISDSSKVTFVLRDGTVLTVPTWESFVKLDLCCSLMNENLEAMSIILTAVGERDYITAINKIYEEGEEVGYTISFNKSGTATIRKGADVPKEMYPAISLALDPLDRWCWKIDGEWLLDNNGNRLKFNGNDGTDGLEPSLTIENGDWYLSYSDGSKYYIAKANGTDGKHGDSMFSSVEADASEVRFTLSSGMSFAINRIVDLDIVFSDDLPAIYPQASVDIRYSVISASDDISVNVYSSGDVKARISASTEEGGVISIKAGDNIDEYCKVVVIVSDGRQVVMKTIFFENTRIVIE